MLRLHHNDLSAAHERGKMGRKSTKENKSIYQITRENLGWTRERAGEEIPGMSPERIEKLENGRSAVQPEDVLLMAKYYKAPALCNYYCARECAIGQESVPEITKKELSQIAIETLNALNKMNRDKERLLEIVEDGEITPDEYGDFVEIKKTLDKISLSVDSLKLWLDERIAIGKIGEDIFETDQKPQSGKD